MRLIASFALLLATASLAHLSSGGRIVSSHGVRVAVPREWREVQAAGDGPVIDPRTLLVVGTAGARPRPSQCQIAAYHVPAEGAVVVIVGWGTTVPGRGPGRAALKRLNTVRSPSFECFAGRGAATQVALGGKLYQVNVMVGDRASPRVVGEALAVGRSFSLTR
jgi:hypothetical protein